MAHHKSAIKRIRQTKKRNEYNRAKKKDIKLAIRGVREANGYEDGLEKLRKLNSVLDKASIKGIIHEKNAARQKARLSKFVKNMKEA